jgi:hypothetical protein
VRVYDGNAESWATELKPLPQGKSVGKSYTTFPLNFPPGFLLLPSQDWNLYGM